MSKISKSKKSEKDYLGALLLSIFVGMLGVDRFYLGHTGTGILKVLSVGGFGIWFLLDIFLIATEQMKDSEGNLVEKK